MKEMTNLAQTMMTDEEKAEIEREMKSASGNGTPQPASIPAEHDAKQPEVAPQAEVVDGIRVAPISSDANVAEPSVASPSSNSLSAPGPSSHASPSTPTSPSPGTESPTSDDKDHAHKRDKKRPKITPEQRKKLEEMEKARREAMEKRVEMLTAKLLERIRPLVEANKPGDPSDPETQTFISKMEREAEDLKLESFGVEVSL
jgi:hypothetical protein